MNVVCQEAAGTKQISTDATIAVPSTIGPSSHAASATADQTSSRSKGRPV